MYPGMTRWDVLAGRQNPDLHPFDKTVLYRFIGNHTTTTIKQNMYCTVQYQQYRLPSPAEIEKLAPRNMKVDAYWLPDADGNVNEVYLYQNGEYICTCSLLERYNEATAEQTAADRAAYTEQAKYVSQFDKMMKDEKIQKVVVMRSSDAREIEQVEARAVPQPVEQPDEDYSGYMDTARYRREAVGSL